ncbi:DUF4190 domain-containing protein [Halobacillus amylolyticus]|uniref:DUF4190 domain-containing protein n=1 Tax=Halobacillus amylolyticus TaxID=2932259 RepID=A0ABY4HBP2_9BACI|nr:DUF4190 domain-containing protein [Halobacillus amylolyticus]UOR12294.1 DUF4190 domain-containing protein [Halobacillus amylolyticus]
MNEPKEPVENRNTEETPEQHEELEQVQEPKETSNEPVYGDSYEEEFAEEAMPMNQTMRSEEQETTMQGEVNTAMAWIGLSAAILSFFFAPLLLGIVGIVFGIIGKRQNANTLGNMAIIISAVSILFSVFFATAGNLV